MSRKDVLSWIILVDRDSRTTYQTSFSCYIPLIETRLILMFFEFFPSPKHVKKRCFVLDHPRGSGFKNDISDEFLLLHSPNRNSSNSHVFRVFSLTKTCQEKMFCLGSSSWISKYECKSKHDLHKPLYSIYSITPIGSYFQYDGNPEHEPHTSQCIVHLLLRSYLPDTHTIVILLTICKLYIG